VLARRYHLIAPLGRGTMGVVWEAYDLAVHRKVAVKEVLLPADMSDHDRAVSRERAQREARAISQLAHPNVIAFYDLVEEAGHPWVVMELVNSRSLADVIRSDGPMQPSRIATLALAVLGALEAAHRAGITHRDVKPSNILLTDDGRVKLTDFGIARTAGDSPITGAGMLVGSPSYIPPEVIQGAAAGPPADMWGLGATLYAAVEARAPFDAGDPMATLHAVVSDPAPSTKRAGPLAEVIDGLLRKDPRRRLDTVKARHHLLDALRAFDRERASSPGISTPAAAPVPTEPPVDESPVNGAPVNGHSISGSTRELAPHGDATAALAGLAALSGGDTGPVNGVNGTSPADYELDLPLPAPFGGVSDEPEPDYYSPEPAADFAAATAQAEFAPAPDLASAPADQSAAFEPPVDSSYEPPPSYDPPAVDFDAPPYRPPAPALTDPAAEVPLPEQPDTPREDDTAVIPAIKDDAAPKPSAHAHPLAHLGEKLDGEQLEDDFGHEPWRTPRPVAFTPQRAEPRREEPHHEEPSRAQPGLAALGWGNDDTQQLGHASGVATRKPPADPHPSRRRSGGRAAGVLVAVAVLCIAGYGGYWLTHRLTGHSKSAGTRSTATATTGRTTNTNQTTQPGKTANNAPYTSYTSRDGYKVDVPTGWKSDPQSAGVIDFNDPHSDRFIRFVSGVESPGALVPSFVSAENAFKADHQNYQRIAIKQVPYLGHQAADWEFTYEHSGATRHVVYRSFIIGDKTYGIYISAPEHLFRATIPAFNKAARTFSVD
jgi:serine/threonine protein kinase